MRKFLIAAVAMSGLMFSATVVKAANDDGKKDDKGWNGVLIDAACGAKQKTDGDAADHPKTCIMKPGCMKSGLGLFHDGKFIKFDEASQAKAKEYLEKEEHGTKVHVTGKLSEDKKEIAVDEIHPQDKAQKTDDEKKEKKE
jgi:hypothetical protein